MSSSCVPIQRSTLLCSTTSRIPCRRRARSSAGMVATSWTCHGTEDNSFTAFCENGVLRLNVEPGDPVVVYPKGGEREVQEVGKIQANTEDKWYLGVIQEFVDAVLGRKPNPIPGIEGYKALEMVVAMEASVETGAWVDLPLKA